MRSKTRRDSRGRRDASHGPSLRGASSAVLLLGSLWAAPPGAAQAPLGPLRTAEQNPFYRLFYVPDAEGADVIGAGRTRIELSSSYSSVFEHSASANHLQLFDMEQLTHAVTVRWGVGPTLELGARADLYTAWGGFLDSLISGLHNALQVSDAGRHNQPEGQYRFLLFHGGQNVLLDVPQRSLQLEELRAFAKWQWYGSGGGPLSMSLKGVLRHYVGSVDPGRTDAALAILARLSRGKTHLHGYVGATSLSPPRRFTELVPDLAALTSIGIERNLTPHLSVLAQLVGGSRYVQGFSVADLNSIPMNVAVGLAGATETGWAWQLSFAEDVPPRSPSVDFIVDLEISRTLGVSGEDGDAPAP